MNDHHVAVGLASNVCRYGAQQAAGQGVDAAVAHDKQVSIVVVDDGHQGLHWGARANSGFDLGSAELLSVCLSILEVCLRLLIAQNGYGILAQGLGSLLLVFVVSTTNNQIGIECGGDLAGRRSPGK